MKKYVITCVAMLLAITMCVSSALAQRPQANFVRDWGELASSVLLPATSSSVQPGKTIQISGYVTVSSGTLTDGYFAYEVYGPAQDAGGTNCKVWCGTTGAQCWDPEVPACQGQIRCPIRDGVNCDPYYKAWSCSDNQGGGCAKTIPTLSAGQRWPSSGSYTATITVPNDAKEGNYIVILYMSSSQWGTLDVEYRDFTVNKRPQVNVVIDGFVIASMVGAVALITKGLKIW